MLPSIEVVKVKIRLFYSKGDKRIFDRLVSELKVDFPRLTIEAYISEEQPEKFGEFGIVATPTVIIGNRRFVGLKSLELLREKIRDYITISELRRELRVRELKLQRLEESWNEVFTRTNDLILLINRRGRIVSVNEAVLKVTGVPPSRILGKRFTAFVLPEDKEKAQRLFSSACEGRFQVEEIRVANDKGEKLYLSVNGIRLEERGEIMVIARDVTEIKRLEAQLFQSQRMAALGELAAGIIHEISNPVSYIRSNLNTLEEYANTLISILIPLVESAEKTPPHKLIQPIIQAKEKGELGFILNDLRKIIDECSSGVEVIVEIITGLRAFSRPVDREPPLLCNVNECIERAVNLVKRRFSGRITLIKEYAVLPDVYCYPNQLTQVFLNLLVNAEEAIEGEGVVEIKSKLTGDRIMVEVKDNGRGIAREDLPHIFDPFFTTKKEGKGLGLGLRISYRIIERHGGEIKAESEEGKGSRFTVFIPLEPQDKERIKIPPAEA